MAGAKPARSGAGAMHEPQGWPGVAASPCAELFSGGRRFFIEEPC